MDDDTEEFGLSPPAEPDPSECCGTGCRICVWDLYYKKLDEYQALKDQWKERKKTREGFPCSISIEEVAELSESTLVADTLTSSITSYETLEFPEISKTILTVKLNKVKYEIGDCVALLPSNNKQLVENLLKQLHYNPGQYIKVSDSKSIIGSPSYFLQNRVFSVEYIFLNVLDLHGSPSQIFLKMLSYYCTDINEKEELECLGDSQSDYVEQVVKKHKNFFDIFSEYSTSQPPLAHFIQYCDIIKERFYSISSSPRVNEDTMELSLNLVTSKNFQGLCSHWLHSKCLSQDNLLEFQIKSSDQFVHLRTLNKECPFIVICHGTSITPFVGFIMEMAQFGGVYLFYGVHYSSNYLYKSVLEKLIGLNCYIAASRDVPSVHVQDKLKEKSENVLELLERSACVLVCGSRKFVVSVEKCIVDMLQKNREEAEAKIFLEELKKNKRFLWESWGE